MEEAKYQSGDMAFIVNYFCTPEIARRKILSRISGKKGDAVALHREDGWFYLFSDELRIERWVPESLVFESWSECFSCLYFQVKKDFSTRMINHFNSEFDKRFEPIDRLIYERRKNERELVGGGEGV